MTNAAGSGAPLGDMIGDRGHMAVRELPGRPRFHAGTGTDRVPRAHRHHAVLPEHRGTRDLRHGPRRGNGRRTFGLLHGKTLTPYRSIWTLAAISAVIGIVTVALYPWRHHPVRAGAKVPENLW